MDLTKMPKIDPAKVPHHVAVVMDGNGRWAKAQGLPRTEGHRAGEAALFDVVDGALAMGIKELSVYAFSTENWNRSPEEVKFLMGFNREVLRNRRDQMNEKNVKIKWVGRPQRLWKSVMDDLLEAQELTKRNKALTLNMCINYGGRAEILDAVSAIARDVTAKKVNPEKISAKTFAKYLYSPEMSDVDLFLRTSGEMRISNFLPWQSVYAEMIFLDKYWPQMRAADLWSAVEQYASRVRRFGKA
jgi:undecaprenyl diphosphate synthase